MNTTQRLSLLTAVSLLIGAIAISQAYAQARSLDSTARWKPPVTRENGDELKPEELAGYRMYKVGEEGATLMAEITSGTSYPFKVPEGECLSLYVTAVDTNDLESKPSDTLERCAMAPGAPTEFQIDVP